jgi:galactokinase
VSAPGASRTPDLSAVVEEVRAKFQERYRRDPLVAIAPGRVNLIGEHTDYNDGFVLPVAIDRYCALAFGGTGDGRLRGFSILDGSESAARLEELSPPGRGSWFDYAAGVVWAHREAGVVIPGLELVVGGDVPMGAGLSSSAAFELAVSRAVIELASAPWDGVAEARIAQRAENEYVGMPCGIMDQMAASISREGEAMLLDCRSLEVAPVPLPDSLLVAVLDTGTRRALTKSAYQERRRSCEDAAAALSVPALRDASLELLERKRSRLQETAYRRALHVIGENARTLEMGDALRRSDGESVSRLMRSSHESLRDLYEVSSPALDRMVEIAWRHPATVGARMTGAGFGGSAVALIDARRAERTVFARDVEDRYRKETGLEGTVHLCRSVDGAKLVR